MSKYYKIKQIASIFGISTKALRLYEEIGLLAPPLRDESNGYRMYSTAQLDRLDHILQLKELGFTLAEIKDYLEDRISYEEKLAKLAKQKQTIEQQILRISAMQNTENVFRSYVKVLPAHYAYCRDAELDSCFDVKNVFADMQELAIKRLKITTPMNCYAIFRDEYFSYVNNKVTCCIEVGKSNHPSVQYMPSQQCLCVCLYNGLDKIEKAYTFLFDQMESNGYTLVGYPSEQYIDTYRLPDSNRENFIIEVRFPFEKSE